LLGLLEPAGGQIHSAAAKTHVVAHHPRTGERLEEVEDLFALAKGVHQRCSTSSHVLRQKPYETGMVLQPSQLAGDDPEVLGAFGYLYSRQRFDSERVRPVIGDGAEVIEPIRVWHGTEVGLLLGYLFVVAMQVAKDRLQLDDALAVQNDIHPKDAVRRGVLRAHRDFEQLGVAAIGRWFRR